MTPTMGFGFYLTSTAKLDFVFGVVHFYPPHTHTKTQFTNQQNIYALSCTIPEEKNLLENINYYSETAELA